MQNVLNMQHLANLGLTCVSRRNKGYQTLKADLQWKLELENNNKSNSSGLPTVYESQQAQPQFVVPAGCYRLTVRHLGKDKIINNLQLKAGLKQHEIVYIGDIDIDKHNHDYSQNDTQPLKEHERRLLDRIAERQFGEANAGIRRPDILTTPQDNAQATAGGAAMAANAQQQGGFKTHPVIGMAAQFCGDGQDTTRDLEVNQNAQEALGEPELRPGASAQHTHSAVNTPRLNR